MSKKTIHVINTLINYIFLPFNFLFFLTKNYRMKHKKKIVLMLTPEFGNLGDHALNFAQQSFFKENYPEYQIVEITYNESKNYFSLVKKLINTGDILVLMGGGNLGDLYLNAEYERRKIITEFKDNKIISMPQSIFFSNSEAGAKELKKAQKVYSQNNLVLFCRDEKSYNFALEEFDNENIYLLPDIVLYWAYRFEGKIRDRSDKALLLFRNDKEKNISEEDKKAVYMALENANIQYTISDTHVDRNLKKETRLVEINKKLQEIKRSKFVVTDRYHGVIFSVITKTPCIVYKSKDHKIEEGIKWFKNHNYVYYLDNKPEEIDSVIEKICKIDDRNIKGSNFKEMFIDFFEENNIIPKSVIYKES